MEGITDFVGFSALVIMAVAAWGLVCNSRTHAQKRALANLVHAEAQRRIHHEFRRGWPTCRVGNSGNWQQLYVLLDRVSYDQHLIALMLCRDPLKLYPPELQELWRRNQKSPPPGGDGLSSHA